MIVRPPLPFTNAMLELLAIIHGLKIQLDARDETIAGLRQQIRLQAETIRELLNERKNT
jgi:hypothetical protein